MAQPSTIPDFDSLPKVKDMPQGCAWGIFDKDGKKDHLRTLNLITPEVVREAVRELDFGRQSLTHNVIDLSEGALLNIGFDDEVSFNTQSSSQWDSLVHVAHQSTGLHYNGTKPCKDDLVQLYGKVDVNKAWPTLNHWHERGCMVGRGVLLDYREYARAHGIKYDCFDAQAVSVQDLEAVAKYQRTTSKHGDILLVRTAYTNELDATDAQGQARLLGSGKAVGAKGNRESAKWIWNHHFAAVAGDQVAFEVIPSTIEEDNNRVGGLNELGKQVLQVMRKMSFFTLPSHVFSLKKNAFGIEHGFLNEVQLTICVLCLPHGIVLHQYFLSLFGPMHWRAVGLEGPWGYCKKARRYEFLLTSTPLNVPGSVDSPPNALAIF